MCSLSRTHTYPRSERASEIERERERKIGGSSSRGARAQAVASRERPIYSPSVCVVRRRLLAVCSAVCARLSLVCLSCAAARGRSGYIYNIYTHASAADLYNSARSVASCNREPEDERKREREEKKKRRREGERSVYEGWRRQRDFFLRRAPCAAFRCYLSLPPQARAMRVTPPCSHRSLAYYY